MTAHRATQSRTTPSIETSHMNSHNNLRLLSDRTAIGLSLLCALHCLAVPLAIVYVPVALTLNLEHKAFHLGMLLLVIPFSVFALTLGCRNHRCVRVAACGIIGLTCMILAVSVGHSAGESIERVLTLLGASFVALAHFRNYRLCQHSAHCNCAVHSIDR